MPPGPCSRQLVSLFNSGAGTAFLTSAHGRLWPHCGSDSITASDAQGNLLVRGAWGCGTLEADADRRGRDIAKLVPKRAYVSDSVAGSLVAYSDMYDVCWRFVDAFDSPISLVDRFGDRVALTRDGDGHLWLEFDVAAAPSTGADPAAAGLLGGR